jgi:hypothetical protein
MSRPLPIVKRAVHAVPNVIMPCIDFEQLRLLSANTLDMPQN